MGPDRPAARQGRLVYQAEKRTFLAKAEQMLTDLGLPAEVLIEEAAATSEPADTPPEPGYIVIKMYGREFGVAKSQLSR